MYDDFISPNLEKEEKTHSKLTIEILFYIEHLNVKSGYKLEFETLRWYYI